MDDVTGFFKLLVEWGGVFTTDSENTIINTDDNLPVHVEINGNPLPLKLFSNNMQVGKHTYFNPLVETLGHSKERAWFFTTRSMILGVMIKKLMVRAIELAITTDDDIDYDKLELIQPFMAKADAKLITEIQSIKPNKILRMVYSKPLRTAQLQTELYDKKFQDAFKFRKKSWDVILGMLESFMGTDDVHETYQYKGTFIGMQESHAMLNLLLMTTQSIHEYVSLLLERDLHYNELVVHMDKLEAYRKSCAWAATGTIQHDKMAAKAADVNVWQSNGSSAVQTMVNPMAPTAPVVQDENEWHPSSNSINMVMQRPVMMQPTNQYIPPQPQQYGTPYQMGQPNMPYMQQQPIFNQQPNNRYVQPPMNTRATSAPRIR